MDVELQRRLGLHLVLAQAFGHISHVGRLVATHTGQLGVGISVDVCVPALSPRPSLSESIAALSFARSLLAQWLVAAVNRSCGVKLEVGLHDQLDVPFLRVLVY